MNTRTIPPINLQVGQRVQRRDGVPGTVTTFDRELFSILWDNGTNYYYEENGKWCASWGADRHDLDVHSLVDSGHSTSLDEPDGDERNFAVRFYWLDSAKTGKKANTINLIGAIFFVFGFILGSILSLIYSVASIS